MAFEFKKKESEIEKVLKKRSPIELAVKYPIEIVLIGDDLPRKAEEIRYFIRSKGLDCHLKIEKPSILPYNYKVTIRADVTQNIIPELLEMLKDIPSVHIRYLFAPPPLKMRRRRRLKRE